ncbi:DHBP synthase RibB-like alpha/beta domain-containing protein [Delphinella strobiligena]|nr:DHBP synthase RibB-like alpha/beta domain-containing protein [Delphinella strobiligena]
MASTKDSIQAQDEGGLSTRVLPVKATNLGDFNVKASELPLEEWDIQLNSTEDAINMQSAADQLRHSDIPIAFPTETVYGLGADATRSAAVKGIYRAKQRPSDNPLIVHIASLGQLRRLLTPGGEASVADRGSSYDPIPAIYYPLIRRFWPGPLTIILPNPEGSPLAPEVTAGLSTFGARMPRNLLALALIRLADVPVAAPSANASTKPSPTAAEHVLHDLNGRIELILDGGLCDIGVESTVVDGLTSPPSILRPGGIGLDQIRSCPGWEGTVIGYRDISEKGMRPRAPGMKYRHYSPKAPVILLEAGGEIPSDVELARHLGKRRTLGVVRTKTWPRLCDAKKPASSQPITNRSIVLDSAPSQTDRSRPSPIQELLQESSIHESAKAKKLSVQDAETGGTFDVWDMLIGPDTRDVARGLFSALRSIDQKEVDAIIVEGIDDDEGDIAAAVMNRLRKAAEIRLDRL